MKFLANFLFILKGVNSKWCTSIYSDSPCSIFPCVAFEALVLICSEGYWEGKEGGFWLSWNLYSYQAILFDSIYTLFWLFKVFNSFNSLKASLLV